MDILSDANGLTFYRFQMLAWTVALGIMFMVSVVRQLVMLDLSAVGSSGNKLGNLYRVQVPRAEESFLGP